MKYNIVYEDGQPTSATLFHNGRPYVATKEHPNFAEIIQGLTDELDEAHVAGLFDTGEAIATGFEAAAQMLKTAAEAVASLGRMVLEREKPADKPADTATLAQQVGENVRQELGGRPRYAEVVASVGQELAPAKVSNPPRYEGKKGEVSILRTDLDDLNQRDLQALARQYKLPSVGKSNQELRESITTARDADAIVERTDDLDTLGQRELQKLAAKHGVFPFVGKSNSYLRKEIRKQQKKFVASVGSSVEVKDGRLFFEGKEMDDALTETIVAWHRAGNRDYVPLVRFLAKLQENPNEHSREHLYGWIKHLSFTIHEDGDIIAYKSVYRDEKHGFISVSSGKGKVNGKVVNGQLPNTPGAIVEMSRKEVTFDPHAGCSAGLHVGTIAYTRKFSGNALIEIKVNPRDVVSVPTHDNWQKLRVCRYEVLREVTADQVRELGKKSA